MTGRELWMVEEICDEGLRVLGCIAKAVFVVWVLAWITDSWLIAIGILLALAAAGIAFGVVCWLVGYASFRLSGLAKDGDA